MLPLISLQSAWHNVCFSNFGRFLEMVRMVKIMKKKEKFKKEIK